MRLPSKTLERKLFNSYDYIVGVDEVGMGCLAGPVVVGAVVLDKKFFHKPHQKLRGLNDSKLLSAKQREVFSRQLLREEGLRYKISFCYPKTIDKINIYQAARLAMRRAVKKLVKDYLLTGQNQTISEGGSFAVRRRQVRRKKELSALIVLIDGPHKIPGLKFDQIPIVQGDRQVFTIACASILAKVYRDKMMADYAKRFPKYGFEKHKGYGTKLHQARLANLGPCSIHRRSFAPVTRLL